MATRRNVALNMLESASFQASMAFVSAGAILPLFVSRHTDAPWALGLVPAIAMLGTLPQALGAAHAARQPDGQRSLRRQTLAARLAHELLLFAPGPAAYALGLFAVGCANVALEVADCQFLLSRGPAACGTAASLFSLATLPAAAGAPLAAGVLAQGFGLPPVLALAGLAWLAGGALVFRLFPSPVRHPAVRPA